MTRIIFVRYFTGYQFILSILRSTQCFETPHHRLEYNFNQWHNGHVVSQRSFKTERKQSRFSQSTEFFLPHVAMPLKNRISIRRHTLHIRVTFPLFLPFSFFSSLLLLLLFFLQRC